ncbi:MAG TPA: sulfotransferase domain-containing protein [Promineifilum sp.]|nr:sulfotransferase domain-containing protein [Promineifilum sp.]HRQ11708.1 sulfotransferase domain-containing protein [Promineifilum sp.]
MKMLHMTKERKGKFHPEHIRNVMRRRYYLDLSSDYRDSLVLAGTGRSGTTWISEVINYRNEYRLMDEPDRNVRIEAFAHFNAIQYIRPDDDNLAWLEPVELSLSGRLRNDWSDRFNTRIVSNKRLVKFIRANLYLKWMVNHFPGLKVAFLMRHPGAVCLSQSRLDWEIDLRDILLVQPQLMEDFLEPFREQIAAADTLFEKRLWMWCVDNYVALSQLETGDAHLAFYESFCEEPEQEIKRLFNFYGKQWDASVYEAMRKPSNSSKPDSAIVTGKNRVDSWMKHITDEQRELTRRMLHQFGLDTIYSVDSPFPDTNAAWEMLVRPAKPLPAGAG